MSFLTNGSNFFDYVGLKKPIEGKSGANVESDVENQDLTLLVQNLAQEVERISQEQKATLSDIQSGNGNSYSYRLTHQEMEYISNDLKKKFEDNVKEITKKLETKYALSQPRRRSAFKMQKSRFDLSHLIGITESEEDDDNDCAMYLDEDTYTMMMISPPQWWMREKVLTRTQCIIFYLMPCTLLDRGSWVFGCIPPFIQLLLCIIIIADQTGFIYSDWSWELAEVFKIPTEAQSDAVYIGQFFTIMLALMTQNDLLSATHTLLHLCDSSWLRTVSRDGKEKIEGGFWSWIARVLIPISLKFTQGLLVLFISWLIIVQSENVVELLKDYTALFVISSIDDLFFYVATQGYFGDKLAIRAEEARGVQIYSSKSAKKKRRIVMWQVFLFFLIWLGMVGGWLYFVILLDPEATRTNNSTEV